MLKKLKTYVRFPQPPGNMCVRPESLKKAAVSIGQWNWTMGMVHEERSGLADNPVQAVFPWSTQDKVVDKDSFPQNLGFIFFSFIRGRLQFGGFRFSPDVYKTGSGSSFSGFVVLTENVEPYLWPFTTAKSPVHLRSVQSVNEIFKPDWTGSYQTRPHCAQV